MSNEKYIFRITLGDWSGDGHGHTLEYRIQSSKPVEEARRAYFAALEKTGLDLTEDICANYEEHFISAAMAARLKELGLTALQDQNEYVGVDDFVDLILAYIKLGDPDLELEQIPAEESFQGNFSGVDFKVLGGRSREGQRHIGFFGYGLL